MRSRVSFGRRRRPRENQRARPSALLCAFGRCRPPSIRPLMRLDSDTGKRERAVMRWALNPFWNGRCEDRVLNNPRESADRVAIRPAFRGSFQAPPLPRFPQIFKECKKLEANTNSRLNGREKEPRPLTARKSFQLTLPYWPCKTHVALPCLGGDLLDYADVRVARTD
jgi:hypothetical protein